MVLFRTRLLLFVESPFLKDHTYISVWNVSDWRLVDMMQAYYTWLTEHRRSARSDSWLTNQLWKFLVLQISGLIPQLPTPAEWYTLFLTINLFLLTLGSIAEILHFIYLPFSINNFFCQMYIKLFMLSAYSISERSAAYCIYLLLAKTSFCVLIIFYQYLSIDI